jgi:alpha-tubulin suppressor-like RCC1 family protein
VAGELDDGSLSHSACFGNDCSLVPVVVVGLSDVVALTLGAYHTCAARSAGGVVCWGNDAEGELGDGTSAHGTCPTLGVACSLVPVATLGVTDAVELGAGWAHACALRASGSVVCWGDGTLGQLGNGVAARSDVPVDVALGSI